MKRTLFVVANRSKARFFNFNDVPVHLNHEEDFVFPEGREHDRDFYPDQQGRYMDTASPNRSNYSPPHTVDENLVKRFVTELTQKIEKRRATGNFEHLILAGDPKFAGHLRRSLSAPSQKLVVSLIPKDIVEEKPEELQKRISEVLKDYPELYVEG